MALAAEAAASATELEEEMVGELQHRHLMDEAIAKLSITFATSAKSVHENSRDIKVEGLNINLGKKELVKDATLSLNWGNRYGLVGANGCGKSLLMTAIGRRLVPIPKSLDIYHVVSEVEASDMKALEAVLAVDTEKKALEAEAEALSHAMEHMTETDEAATEIMSERVADIYDRLDMLEAATAEARAASILHGLGFTVDMQSKRCRDFSGGWRMRISLARALFLDSSILLLDGACAIAASVPPPCAIGLLVFRPCLHYALGGGEGRALGLCFAPRRIANARFGDDPLACKIHQSCGFFLSSFPFIFPSALPCALVGVTRRADEPPGYGGRGVAGAVFGQA